MLSASVNKRHPSSPHLVNKPLLLDRDKSQLPKGKSMKHNATVIISDDDSELEFQISATSSHLRTRAIERLLENESESDVLSIVYWTE